MPGAMLPSDRLSRGSHPAEEGVQGAFRRAPVREPVVGEREGKMASVIEEPTQDLAQFEPDPEGHGEIEAQPDDASGDTQWVVWADPEGESAWAASELDQIAPRRIV